MIPGNPKARRGGRGLNENYGRELMELHTLGVNGGYTQADVTALSAILTGWGVARPQAGDAFSFDPRKHEPGTKTWLGYRITDDGEVTRVYTGGTESWSVQPDGIGNNGAGSGMGDNGLPPQEDGFRQGLAALRILAASPKTAHFIAYKLAQYFVADEPPPALVDRLTAVYLSSDGEIKVLLRALIASPEFKAREYFRTKVKTPEEFLVSAFRATGTDPQNPGAMVNVLKQMGMEPYHALPPTGYALTADHWMNSVALVDRLNFAYQLTSGRFANQKFDAAQLLAIGLLHPGGEATARVEEGVAGAGPRLPRPAGFAVPAGMPSRLESAGELTGAQLALRLLEGTMMDVPLSARTGGLIVDQLRKQAAEATPADTLNLLTALVLGSPDFQLR